MKTGTCTTFIVILISIYPVNSFEPLTKEEQIKQFDIMDQGVEPFRKNLTECARQVKASMADVETFLKRVPQTTMQGKCFVACILKRNSVIKDNQVSKETLIEIHKAVYGEDLELLDRLQGALNECAKAVGNVFEICEYASIFNDCMNIKMEHVLDRVNMERRMESVGKMTEDPDEWSAFDDDLLKLVKDEL